MREVHVRRFRSGDGDTVRELNRAAMAETPEWVPDAPDTDLDDVAGHYLDGDGEFLVVEADGEVVATGAYAPLDGWMAEQFGGLGGRVAELTRMRVHPGHQRRGIGTQVC